ncbi:MAG: thioredoxin fold domain-containing protein [Cocleimonas sp.]
MITVTKFILTLLLFCFCGQAVVIADENKVEVKAAHIEKVGEFRGAKDATHPTWFKESFLDLEEDIAEATENKKRLVVYFWQPGCPYCDQLWDDNFADQKVVDEFRQNFDIVALNMWGDREIVNVGGTAYSEKSFAEALGIKYTPTLLFFDENRKIIHQLNGYVPIENFQKSMNYVSGKHEKSVKFSEFSMIENKNIIPKTKSGLNKQDFFITPAFNLDRRNIQDSDDKYTAVFFEAENCENCDLLHQKTLEDETTLALVEKFIAVQLDRYSDIKLITPNGDNTTAKQWATDLGVEYLPAMIFFNNDGSQIMRVDTQLRTFHVQSVFDYVLSGAYKTEANFQRYISARADSIRETGIDVDIFAY